MKERAKSKPRITSGGDEKLLADLEKYCKMALDMDADGAMIVPSTHIVQSMRSRLACFFPLCYSFGTSYWCPPNWETGFDVARAIVQSYKYAVFFRFFYKPEWYTGPLGGGSGLGGLLKTAMDHYEDGWKPEDVEYWRDYIEKHRPRDKPEPLSRGIPDAIEAEARRDGHQFAFFGSIGPCASYLCGPNYRSRCVMLRTGLCRFPGKGRPEGAAALYYDYPRTLPNLGWRNVIAGWSVLPEDVESTEIEERIGRTSFVLIE